MEYLKKAFKNIDYILIISVVCLGIISIIMISSIDYNDGFVFSRSVIIQLLSFVVGFVVLGGMLLFDYNKLKSVEKPLYIISILMLLTVYIPGLGATLGGSTNWIKIGPIFFQPSELVKITFAIIFASYLSRNPEKIKTFKGVMLSFLYAVPFILIVLKGPDLGNAIILAVITVSMIFVAGIKGPLLSKLALGAALITPFIYSRMANHQKVRIDAFLHPNDLTFEGNYQIYNSKIAIGSGSLLGKGLFNGTQKSLKYLPVQESDFIFAVIVEELGFLGGALVILLYSIFLFRLIVLTNTAKDLFGALIVVGIFAMFAFQIFENIGMTMGIMPVTGVTLPFISAGGTSVLVNMLAIGLALTIGVRSKSINF